MVDGVFGGQITVIGVETEREDQRVELFEGARICLLEGLALGLVLEVPVTFNGGQHVLPIGTGDVPVAISPTLEFLGPGDNLPIFARALRLIEDLRAVGNNAGDSRRLRKRTVLEPDAIGVGEPGTQNRVSTAEGYARAVADVGLAGIIDDDASVAATRVHRFIRTTKDVGISLSFVHKARLVSRGDGKVYKVSLAIEPAELRSDRYLVFALLDDGAVLDSDRLGGIARDGDADGNPVIAGRGPKRVAVKVERQDRVRLGRIYVNRSHHVARKHVSTVVRTCKFQEPARFIKVGLAERYGVRVCAAGHRQKYNSHDNGKQRRSGCSVVTFKFQKSPLVGLAPQARMSRIQLRYFRRKLPMYRGHDLHF